MLSLISFALLPGPHAPHQTTLGARRSSALVSNVKPRGSLLRVVHQVADPGVVAGFYEAAFGFQTLSKEKDTCGRERMVVYPTSATIDATLLPQLELVGIEVAGSHPTSSYPVLWSFPSLYAPPRPAKPRAVYSRKVRATGVSQYASQTCWQRWQRFLRMGEAW